MRKLLTPKLKHAINRLNVNKSVSKKVIHVTLGTKQTTEFKTYDIKNNVLRNVVSPQLKNY